MYVLYDLRISSIQIKLRTYFFQKSQTCRTNAKSIYFRNITSSFMQINLLIVSDDNHSGEIKFQDPHFIYLGILNCQDLATDSP